MVINHIQSNLYIQRAHQHLLHLKEGQIVEGKIVKLYPDQHAEIKIGSTSLIGRVETPLHIGKSYYFQVKEIAGDIYLKVLQELQRQEGTLNITALMKQLQIGITHQNHSFIEQLIEKGIPFQQHELSDAIQLLQTASDKVNATEVIQSMLQQKLPLTDSVFQALLAYQKHDFSTLLQAVYTDLEQQSIHINKEQTSILMKQLAELIQRPQSLAVQISQIIRDDMMKGEAVLTFAQLLGIVDGTKGRRQIWQALQQYIQSESVRDYPLRELQTNEQLIQLLRTTQSHVNVLVKNESALRKVALKILAIFHPINTNTLQANDLSALRQMIELELNPLLPEEVRTTVTSTLSNMTTSDQSALLKYIQTFMDTSGYESLKHMGVAIQQSIHKEAHNVQQHPQQQFLTHLTNVLQSLGLNVEHELVQALQLEQQNKELLIQQSQTIKSLLLYMMQHSGTAQENMQKLLHFINGLQLQSLTESNQMYQAQFMLPGYKMALNSDMFLQFESKKTSDESIDADYCRVFFVLDLQRLQETIVDMQIQKRIISITIYTSYPTPKNKIDALQKVMQTNLSALQYQLSAVQWKPLYTDKGQPVPKTNWADGDMHPTQEGFDYRI